MAQNKEGRDWLKQKIKEAWDLADRQQMDIEKDT